MRQDPATADLSRGERLTLEFLGAADFRILGECDGRHLDALVAAGRAQVTHRDNGRWARVSLTSTGQLLLAKLREPA